MKRYYLAYGSNLNTKQMKVRCPHTKKVDSIMFEGYELEFRTYLTIKPSKVGVVPLGIWEIDAFDEAIFDRYEGYPTFYRKEYFEVNFKGKEITELVYIMNENVRKVETPSAIYM